MAIQVLAIYREEHSVCSALVLLSEEEMDNFY